MEESAFDPKHFLLSIPVWTVVDKSRFESEGLIRSIPKAMTDEFMLERFRNEVRIARRISHPNVCRVYDIGETDKQAAYPRALGYTGPQPKDRAAASALIARLKLRGVGA